MPACQKPESRKRIKAKKYRAEMKVEQSVRAACVERDGWCRIYRDFGPVCMEQKLCSGPSEWAHLEPRARTRGMAPEQRHNTATSLMLCKKHHDDFDGKIGGKKLSIEPETDKGADGPLRFRRL